MKVVYYKCSLFLKLNKAIIKLALIIIIIQLIPVQLVTSAAYAFESNNELASESIRVRKPSKEKINAYRDQRDFSYARSLKPVDSLWDNFWSWVAYQIGRLLGKTSYDLFWKPFFYFILIGSIILVILKLFGVELRAVFAREPASVELPYQIVEENIHELNLDELINEATERKNYRLAIRYLYLKLLKQLNDTGFIEWKQGKTNHMYAGDLRKSSMYKPFEYLTTQFEYTWYGEFEINAGAFEIVRSKFNEFGNNIPERSASKSS